MKSKHVTIKIRRDTRDRIETVRQARRWSVCATVDEAVKKLTPKGK